MEILLGIAALFAVAALGARFARRRIVERRAPGGSRTTAIPIEDYRDIDVAVRLQACSCGGRFLVRGEGPLADNGRSLRVARLECRQCGRERRLYFDLGPTRR